MTSNIYNVIKANELASCPEIKFENGIVANINRDMKKMFDKVEPFDNDLLSYNKYILNKAINSVKTKDSGTKELFRQIIYQPVERITVPQCTEVKLWFLFKDQNKIKIMKITNGTDKTMEITELGEFTDQKLVKSESKQIKYTGTTDISTEEMHIDKSHKYMVITLIIVIILCFVGICVFYSAVIKRQKCKYFFMSE